ncbi:MAG TPA: hypothetical protein VIW03_07490 [Anaeromyxobacter sp.]
MTRQPLPLFLASLLASCAGAQHPWPEPTTCELAGPEATAPGPEKWIKLLLRGYDPESRKVTSPALDCRDTQVRWEAPSFACFDNALATTMLPPRPLGEADVIVSRIGDGFGLTWVITNRFASGDALGPVAIVEQKEGRLAVHALGALRAYPDKATLRLEKLGGLTVLVAEGQLCASADPATCVRSARLMPLRGDRFSPEPLFSEVGACASPAWFDLDRRESAALETGWTRRNTLAASLVFGPEGLRVEEQLVVHDLDPRDKQARPRVFRKADGERTVKPVEAKLVTTGRSVWSTVVGGGK